jgi:hypothetical protein
MDKGKALATFLVGSAVGVGAGLLMSKMCKVGTPPRRTVLPKKPEAQEPTPYPCTVPEGADICYPQ